MRDFFELINEYPITSLIVAFFVISIIQILKNESGRIDRGDNEELFLALAALRDDSDYMQYFTNGTDFIKCERKKWLDVLRAVFGDRNEYMDELGKYHKATPTEIIAHFKQKE